jgi:hypothetical protein
MNTDLFQGNFNKNLLYRNDYDLFGNDIYENLHWGKLFVHLFGQYFSRYRIQQRVNNEKLIEYLIRHYAIPSTRVLRIDHTLEYDFRKVNYERSEILLILKDGFFFGIVDNQIDLIYGPNISESERNHLLMILDVFKINEPTIRKFHMVQLSHGSFTLADFDVKPFDIDIQTHYNDDFQNIHKLIIDSLTTKDKNGLVLLHGKYGSGKTYYLRHLISKIDRKFIYFPLNMIESLNSPEFLPFISEQPDSVLILEDCESLLVHREKGLNNASALSNLLNLGDGLLSDALSVNVICTFNAGIKKIDDAILRKGRLLARYEFKELEPLKAQTLAQKIGKHITIDHPMTVSDIYNIEENSFENQPTKKIGFIAA